MKSNIILSENKYIFLPFFNIEEFELYLIDILVIVEARYEELTKLISDPEVIANQTEWQKLIKEHSSIEEVVQKYREYKKEKQRMEDAKEMMNDPEMKDLAEEEMLAAKEKLPLIDDENNLKGLITIKDIENGNYKVLSVKDLFDYKIYNLNEDEYNKVKNGSHIKIDSNEDKLLLYYNNEEVAIYKKKDEFYVCDIMLI